MTSALGSLTTNFGYSPSPTAGTSSVLAQTADPAVARIAIGLSTNASVIATFGTSGTEVLTYTSSGLLNAIAQAGAAPESLFDPAPGTNIQAFVQQALDQSIADTFLSDPASSGLYTASGTFQSLPGTDLASNWATVLQAHPELASVVIANSFAQGAVGTLLATV